MGDLQRSNSDEIETHFDETLKTAEQNLLNMDYPVLRRDDSQAGESMKSVLSTRSGPGSLLALETSGLDEDCWLVASPAQDKGAAGKEGRTFPSPPSPPEGDTQASSAAVASRKRSISSPEPIAQSQTSRRLYSNGELGSHGSAATRGLQQPRVQQGIAPSPPRISTPASPQRESKIPRSPVSSSASVASSRRTVPEPRTSLPGSPSRLPVPGSMGSPSRSQPAGASNGGRGPSVIESRIPKPRSGSAAGGAAGTVQGAAKLTKNAVEGSAVSSTSSTRSGSRGRKRPGSPPKKPKEELEKGWVDVVEPPPEADEEAVLPSPEVAGEALALAANMSRPSQDGDAAPATSDAVQPDDARLAGGCITEAAAMKPCVDAKPEQPVTASLGADSSRQIDAATQVTPKINDGIPGVQHPARQPKGCACCTVM